MRKTARRRLWWVISAVVVLLIISYGYWTLNRSLPALAPTSSTVSTKSPLAASSLNWPSVGQSAVGLVGTNILQTHGIQKPVPIASTAKLITALSVLHEKPLSLGEQGPLITLGASDVALYNSYLAQDGSVVRVSAGEQISEYQMLEGMLLPSANNLADSLAVWAFGSLPTYSSFANSYIAQLGLSNTRVGSDASGFLPSSTSTAGDLVKLGELAIQNPIIAGIVSQPTVGNFPVVGSIKNVNYLLGKSNIIGIKTGNSDQAGGVYISASRVIINHQPVTIITSLANVPTLVEALNYSLPLINSAQTNFQVVTLLKAGSLVGSYHQPWGGSDQVVSSQDLNANVWKGVSETLSAYLNPVAATAQAGQTVGHVSANLPIFSNQTAVPLVLQTSPTKPNIWWRLSHPIK
jgi:D-alanyl-D-alanine carboxypeptidase (penicillin-binding protein 5/6)